MKFLGNSNSLKQKDINQNFKYILTILKIIPITLAMIFTILLKNENSDLYSGIFIALSFCILGDIFIDRNLIQGMLFFAIAHLFFIITFLYGIIIHLVNFTSSDLVILSLMSTLILIYNYTFVKYLILLKLPDKYRNPIILYSILISIMFVTSSILSYVINIGALIALPIGALLFVTSDSLIAIREFREKEMDFSVIKIMGSYYLAIFLISVTSLSI
jgi:uncharacterized membrane protein YhhN